MNMTEEKSITTKKDVESLKAIIRSFIFGNKLNEKLSSEQITMCEQTALIFNLNPLKREIHFIPRAIKKKNPQGYWIETGKYDVSIVIGYENYIRRAPQTILNGWGVTFEGQGTALKAILTIYRKDWERPFVHEIYLSEVAQKSPIWEKMPRFMLRKTVISQGFRLCFPEDLGGMPYTPEELGLGVIEGGELRETPQKVENAPTPLISPKKAKFIADLFAIKGKKQNITLAYFKVKRIAELTTKDADPLIKKLNNFPDADKVIDAEEDPSEHIDLDQVEKGIEEMNAQAAA
jgi:hypothetical protein